MTPKERLMKALAGGVPDRVPIVVNAKYFGMWQAGCTMAECMQDARKYVDSQLRCLEAFDYDAVWDLSLTTALGEAMGSGLTIHDDYTPCITRYVLPDPEGLGRLPRGDITALGRIPYLLSATSELKLAVGETVPVVAIAAPPFEVAITLRGADQLFKDLIRHPVFARELMEYCVPHCIDYAAALVKAGADLVWIPEPQANTSCISRRHFEGFAHPYTRRMFQALRENGVKIVFHVCGDWSDRFDLVSNCGAHALHVDRVDLAALKAAYGKQVALMGNVKSVAVMLDGTTEDVERESRECIENAATDGGFILSPDCGLPPLVPYENILALVNAGKKYGLYANPANC